MHKALIVLLLLFLAQMGVAQQYVDLLSLDHLRTAENTFDSSSNQTQMQEWNVDLTLPIVLNDKLAILTGAIYEETRASFQPNRNAESLYGTTLKIGMNVNHNESWSATYMLLPKLSSDFKSLSNKDFQLGGAVLVKKEINPKHNYKVGLYANSELFGAFVVPIFGFYHLSQNNQWEVKLLLPLNAQVQYQLKPNWSAGFSFKGQVRTYNLNTTFQKEVSRYVARSTNDLQLYVDHQMKNSFHIQLGIGHSVARSYRVYEDKVKFGMPLLYFGDDRKQLNTNFSDGAFIRLKAFYRLSLEE